MHGNQSPKRFANFFFIAVYKLLLHRRLINSHERTYAQRCTKWARLMRPPRISIWFICLAINRKKKEVTTCKKFREKRLHVQRRRWILNCQMALQPYFLPVLLCLLCAKTWKKKIPSLAMALFIFCLEKSRTQWHYPFERKKMNLNCVHCDWRSIALLKRNVLCCEIFT